MSNYVNENVYKKRINKSKDIEQFKKFMNDMFNNHKKKEIFFDNLITEKKDQIKKLESDIKELIKERSNIFDIERSFMILCNNEENKINYEKQFNKLKSQSYKTPTFIENYDKPILHEVLEDDLNEFGHASEICIEELNNAKYLNLNVSIGDIVDTAGHRHYGYSFVGTDLSLQNTIRDDALDQEFGLTVPLSISRNFKNTLKKYKDFKREGCIVAFELPYWDHTVKKYNVPRNCNYLYTYYLDLEYCDYADINDESYWYLDAVPICKESKLKRFEKVELRNIDELEIDNMYDTDKSDNED